METNWKLPKLPPWLAIVLTIFATAVSVVTVTLLDSDDDGSPDTIRVTVNQAKGDGQPAKTIEAPAPAVERAADDLERDLEAAPADAPTPTDANLKRAAEVQTHVEALPEAGAVQGFDGCVTRIIPVNFSSRNGARATWFVLHYTVSHNVIGWADVNAIVALFSNRARQASSNFVIDAEGHCAYIVPIEAKAWTQAGGNPWSISVEVIAFGNESAYLGTAGWAKLKSVARQVKARTGIPLARGQVTGTCTPAKAGIVQHKDFGLCGGGHVDITPFSIDAAVRRLATSPVLTSAELRIVKSVRAPKGTGHSRRYWCQRVGTQIGRIQGEGHRRPARKRILLRVWKKECS